MSSSACCSESLMPPSRTYSKVIHSRLRRGKCARAASSFAMFHFRVMGMISRAQRFVGGVQRDGQLGADGLAAEVGDARHDAGGGDGHARLGNADAWTSRRTACMKLS